MTLEEIETEFWEMFPQAPSPEHHPNQFHYYLEVYKYFKLSEKRNAAEAGSE